MIELPTEFYTERLMIRMPLPGDGEKVFKAINASITELKPWLPFAQKQQTLEDVEENIREAHVKFLSREDLRLLIFSRETGELIGCSGLHRINWDIPKCEIGYWIDTRYSGKGYMTEAITRITEYAFKEIKAKRVEICCDEQNDRSRAVAERLDFTLDAILKNDDLSPDGKQVRNTCIYSKVTDQDNK
ncbi:GNAT family N-acetyltransferase [Evansella cellulosilytica]|uniref:GCN5-related N-acetyltransferase n=1 Tax=Evansella cellulosilytica (strain ATCC 21833 / DSM 2522 / FERM P-1141 / JCM 9156 / N-4) TaxID=649639 RepID=E6U1D3_EVAC2|nr:GNAT family N-acetyltransferase [Evansella cellulosilytica]ADU29180.1 GCN5-related N-acetyltransferase [Evansella cellulosilytica DSM 2522]